jgi:hypothetical protein
MNPDFFKGTVVEDAVDALKAERTACSFFDKPFDRHAGIHDMTDHR